MSDIEKGHDARIADEPTATGSRGIASRVPGAHIANPGALGLFSFASTTFILSLFNVAARNVHTPNAVVGMALFCGGLAQLLAGMWEFPKGNMFGATAFTSYGAFWLSYATILIPGSGIGAAYTDPSTGIMNEKEFANAIGIYLFTWFIVTFLLFIVALRKNISFIALFGCLWLTFLLLGTAEFTGMANVGTAGGAVGIVTALIAYYIGLSELLTAEKAAVARLPLGIFKHD